MCIYLPGWAHECSPATGCRTKGGQACHFWAREEKLSIVLHSVLMFPFVVNIISVDFLQEGGLQEYEGNFLICNSRGNKDLFNLCERWGSQENWCQWTNSFALQLRRLLQSFSNKFKAAWFSLEINWFNKIIFISKFFRNNPNFWKNKIMTDLVMLA